jgi:hypothetical protein
MPLMRKDRSRGGAVKQENGRAILRLSDRDTRIKGMNIAAAAAREYLKKMGQSRPWPGRVARLVDANLSLMGQRIMIRVRRYEREGKRESAERAFHDGMREVGIASAKEFLTKGA